MNGRGRERKERDSVEERRGCGRCLDAKRCSGSTPNHIQHQHHIVGGGEGELDPDKLISPFHPFNKNVLFFFMYFTRNYYLMVSWAKCIHDSSSRKYGESVPGMDGKSGRIGGVAGEQSADEQGDGGEKAEKGQEEHRGDHLAGEAKLKVKWK